MILMFLITNVVVSWQISSPRLSRFFRVLFKHCFFPIVEQCLILTLLTYLDGFCFKRHQLPEMFLDDKSPLLALANHAGLPI